MTNDKEWNFEPLNIPLEQIFQTSDKFCFLVGSGISLDFPSCLPTGYELIKTLIDYAIPIEKKDEIISLTNPNRMEGGISGGYLRFESLMQYFKQYIDLDLSILNLYRDCANPNSNHSFLAQMILKEHHVFTSNFDSLIEYALLKEGKLKPEEIFPVISKGDWEKVQNIRQSKIYKLHGSLLDVRNDVDCRESLQATITQISKQKGYSFTLEKWKLDVLKSLIQDHDLLVVGYSGLDDFDIIPSLWNINSNKRIIWINHCNNKHIDQIEILSLSHLESNHKKEHFKENPRLEQLLKGFLAYQTRQPKKIIVVSVDTRILVHFLSNNFVNNNVDINPKKMCRKNIIDLNLKISQISKWKITGKIFKDFNFLSESIVAYKNAIEIARKEHKKDEEGVCLSQIGAIFISKTDLTNAFNYYTKVNEIAKKIKSLDLQSTALNGLGIILTKQKKFTKATRYLEKALGYDIESNDISGIGDTLHNLGSVHRQQNQLDKAIEYYRQAKSFDDKFGNIFGKGLTLMNIGKVFQEKEDYKKALEYYLGAWRIFEQTGNLRSIGFVLHNIAKLLENQNLLTDTIPLYKESIKIADQTFDLKEKTFRLNNLGFVYKKLGKHKKALLYYQRSLKIDQERKDFPEIAIKLTNIGSLLFATGHYRDSLKYYNKVIKLKKQLGDYSNMATYQSNIEVLKELIESEK